MDPLSPHETIKHAVTELRTQLAEVIYATWKNGFPRMAVHSPISQNLLVLLQPFLQMAVARPNSEKTPLFGASIP